MSSITVANRAGEHIAEELRGVSSDPATIAAGQVLRAGAVLGRITATGLYAQFDPAAVDGTATAAGILFDAVDASAGNRPGVVHNWSCAMVTARLAWKAGLTADDKAVAIADLARLGIKAR